MRVLDEASLHFLRQMPRYAVRACIHALLSLFINDHTPALPTPSFLPSFLPTEHRAEETTASLSCTLQTTQRGTNARSHHKTRRTSSIPLRSLPSSRQPPHSTPPKPVRGTHHHHTTVPSPITLTQCYQTPSHRCSKVPIWQRCVRTRQVTIAHKPSQSHFSPHAETFLVAFLLVQCC